MVGDPHFSNVSLLLHMDGDNNSTAFIDSSSALKTVTSHGDAKISTAQSKWGGASAYFDGTGDYLTVPHSTGLDLTTGDFTIDAWVYCTALIAFTQEIIDKDGVSGSSYPSYALGITSGGYLWAFLGNGGGVSPAGTAYTGSSTVTLNVWHHVALVKTGSTCKGYLDGVQQWSSTAATMYNGSKPLMIASYQGQSSGTSFRGYVDDLRITKGIARYITDFTLPAAAFPGQALLSISGLISESLAANIFIARAYDVETGVLAGSKAFTDTNDFTIDITIDAKACNVTVGVNYNIWEPETVYGLDDLVFPTNPVAKPYYYKRIASGTSGATEPVWPTTPGGFCNDGAVSNAWELVGRLVQPVTHGPLIPS